MGNGSLGNIPDSHDIDRWYTYGTGFYSKADQMWMSSLPLRVKMACAIVTARDLDVPSFGHTLMKPAAIRTHQRNLI